MEFCRVILISPRDGSSPRPASECLMTYILYRASAGVHLKRHVTGKFFKPVSADGLQGSGSASRWNSRGLKDLKYSGKARG